MRKSHFKHSHTKIGILFYNNPKFTNIYKLYIFRNNKFLSLPLPHFLGSTHFPLESRTKFGLQKQPLWQGLVQNIGLFKLVQFKAHGDPHSKYSSFSWHSTKNSHFVYVSKTYVLLFVSVNIPSALNFMNVVLLAHCLPDSIYTCISMHMLSIYLFIYLSISIYMHIYVCVCRLIDR